MYPLPVGWIRPQAAPTSGFLFIRSTTCQFCQRCVFLFLFQHVHHVNFQHFLRSRHLYDCFRLEVHISIKSKQECVFRSHLQTAAHFLTIPQNHLFLCVRQGVVVHQLMSKEVVHVHDLRPPANRCSFDCQAILVIQQLK